MNSRTYQVVTNFSCNLDCTYCYERKNTAVNDPTAVVDFITACFNRDRSDKEIKDVSVTFIGGEPLMCPDLISTAMEAATQLAVRDSRRVYFSLSTNGTLFHKPRVRRLIEKWGKVLNIGISLDGTPDVHDKYRVFASDGGGSYSAVVAGLGYIDGKVKAIGFKATFTKDTFKHYSTSMKHILDVAAGVRQGVSNVGGNVVFEDILDKEMAPMIANKMIEVIDYWVKLGLHKKPQSSLSHFTPRGNHIADLYSQQKVLNLKNCTEFKSVSPDHTKTYCGSCSAMTCLGFDRKVYGCNRFIGSTSKNVEIGTLSGSDIIATDSNLKTEVRQQFTEYPDECQRCALKSICGSCAAAPYEVGDGNKEDRQEYHAEKRQCGWTFAKVIAFDYWYHLFGSYDYRDEHVKK